MDPQIRGSDESLEAAEVSPEERPFLPPPPRQVRQVCRETGEAGQVCRETGETGEEGQVCRETGVP